MSEPSIALIWNPNSGRASEAGPIREFFQSHDHVSIIEPTGNDDTIKTALDAIAAGVTRIIAAGGDGTLNSVVNGIMQADRRPELSILPMGTANDFALMTLAMPNNLVDASEICLFGAVRPIDVIEFQSDQGHHYFANVAAGGNSDEVTRRLTPEMKDRWGPLCYLRGAINVVPEMRVFETTFSLDDAAPQTRSLWNIVVANGRTNAGHLRVAPHANPEDGLLDVVLIKDGDWLDIADLVARYAVADFLESGLVEYHQCRTLHIHSKPMMRYSFDGEAIASQPNQFRVLPGAISMVTGKPYHAVESTIENDALTLESLSPVQTPVRLA